MDIALAYGTSAHSHTTKIVTESNSRLMSRLLARRFEQGLRAALMANVTRLWHLGVKSYSLGLEIPPVAQFYSFYVNHLLVIGL